MELSAKHHEYWRRNLVITAILLAVWFVATFVEAWYARELNALGVKQVAGDLFVAPGFTMNFSASAKRSGEQLYDTFDSTLRRAAAVSRASRIFSIGSVQRPLSRRHACWHRWLQSPLSTWASTASTCSSRPGNARRKQRLPGRSSTSPVRHSLEYRSSRARRSGG